MYIQILSYHISHQKFVFIVISPLHVARLTRIILFDLITLKNTLISRRIQIMQFLNEQYPTAPCCSLLKVKYSLHAVPRPYQFPEDQRPGFRFIQKNRHITRSYCIFKYLDSKWKDKTLNLLVASLPGIKSAPIVFMDVNTILQFHSQEVNKFKIIPPHFIQLKCNCLLAITLRE